MLLLLAAARVSAQSLYYPDQPLPENLFLPLIHIHGLSDTTFFIGGEMATNPASGHIRDLWQFAGDSLGLNAMEFRGEYPMHKMDTLFPDSVTKGNRRLMCWIDKVSWESAWGRQVTFFPFDYAESYYWPCKFLTRSGGVLGHNDEVRDDHKALASEQVYDSTNTTPGATVAQQIVFGYDPMQTNRYPNHAHYQLTQNGETIIHNNHFNFGQASWYIAVTGHLFTASNGGGGAIDSDSLLAIDIYNEVPKDSAYLDSSTPVVVYLNTARTIDTAIIDSVIHTEVWDVITNPNHPSLPPTIIPATSRAAFLASITARYAPTRILVRDSSLADINFASFNDSATEHNDPYWRLVSLHARRDTLLQHHLEEGAVRDRRISRITGTYNFYRHRATADTAFLYKTIFVRKADLLPDTSGIQPDYNTYRTPSYQLNLARERGGMSGPADAINGLARFDIRVRWTGKEKVALRSVAIRDTLGEMLLGDGPESVAYRQEVVDSARSLYYGTAHPSPTALPRETIPLAYFGDEPVFSEYAGFNAIDRLLRDSTAPGGDTTRSLRPHYEVNQLTPHKVLISRSPLVEPGFYPSSAGDDHGCDVFGLDHFYFQPPSLRMHDGGKWNVPWLGETADSVELFEKAFQRATIDEYNPGLRSFPFQWSKLTDLGIAAHAASHTGRWLIPWVGVHGQVNFKWITTGGVASLEPDMQWIMEAAQVRLMCNLALCYGARGVHYAWVGSDTNETLDQKTPIDANHPHMFGTNFGPLGFFTDRTADRVSPFVVHIDTLNSTTHQFNGVTSSIASFYTGWGVRLREMQWLDKTWFPSVGKQMLKLRWRDGYSVHFTVPQSYMNIEYQTDHRPLPSTEIVTAVQSWKPSIDDAPIQIDPPAKTYVELGFFNTVKGIDTTNRMLDQNYVFVVNRRVFERPDDTSAASAYGKKLDSLAETRTISLKLNLPHPDQSGYNFLHVTEIEPDTVALPLIGARHGLDTIVYGDSTVNLTLRPGGGALLRIAYAPPSTSFTGGDIRYNNQRKMVFDGRRYHACYYKPITYRYPFDKGNPLWKSLTGSEDAVFYRRSFPMTDTTGGIRWEPMEYLVSDTTADSTVRQNRFPSMSVRVQGDRNGQGTVNGDTVVTIVWSRYRGPGARSVCLRNVRSNGNGAVQISNRPETVGLFSGYYDGKSGEPAWGTPVVSRLDGGELIAWSDSAQGICARVRTLGSGTSWWQWLATNVRYTPVFVVSSPAIVPAWSPSPPGVCMFPSLPASAHVRGLDSNVGIVWQDMRPNFTIRIDYARLVHRMFGGQDWMAVVNPQVISDLLK
ncbi:MAG: hypothetical protein ABI743_06585 [bacterium]